MTAKELKASILDRATSRSDASASTLDPSVWTDCAG